MDIDRTRAQILLATQSAHLGVGSWMHERAHLFGLADVEARVMSTRDTVLINATLTWLAAHRLITFAEPAHFGSWMTSGFDDPWESIMSENLVAAVAATMPPAVPVADDRPGT